MFAPQEHSELIQEYIFYRCSDPEVSNKRKYPTFTRMEPPDTQVTSSVLALLAYYKWFKFTIVYQDDGRWDTIAEHLITQAENRNFTINNSTSFKDSTACCVANPPLPCCNEVSVVFILITVC